MTRRKRGYTLAIIGLLLGLSTGLGIVVLKQYLSDQLTELLDSEVTASTPCNFSIRSLEVHLLSLTARGTDAQILCEGGAALYFPKLEADFSVRRIRQHLIDLTELRLYEGQVNGIGPDSATYRFVDRLTAPIAPERDYPGRWKLKLQGIRVIESGFTERLGENELRGQGVDLDVRRTVENNFLLKPSVRKLTLGSGDNTHTLKATPDREIGRLSGVLYLDDDYVEFRSIRLALQKSFLGFSGRLLTSESNTLGVDTLAALDSKTLDVPNWLQFALKSAGRIEGTLSNPKIGGSFSLIEQTAATFSPIASPTPGEALFSFDTVEGEYQISTSPEFRLTLPRASLSGQRSSISISEPIILTPTKISGSIEVRLQELILGSAVLKDIGLSVDLIGTIKSPELQLKGTLAEAQFAGLTLRNLSTQAKLSAQRSLISLSQHDGRNTSFTGDALIRHAPNEDAKIESLKLIAHQFSLSPGLTISGSFSATSPSLTQSIQGKGLLELYRIKEEYPFVTGVLNANNDILSVTLATKDRSLDGKLTVPLIGDEPAKLEVSAKKFAAGTIFEQIECLEFDGTLTYQFSRDAPLNGTGSLALSRLPIGCAPYQLDLAASYNIPIINGVMKLPAMSVRGSDSEVGIRGEISLSSGYDLDLTGRLELSVMLGILPRFDDVHGTLVAKVGVHGPFDQPVIRGTAHLEGGEFSIESAGIAAESISGNITLDRQQVLLERLEGRLNGGTFSLEGAYFPEQVERSDLRMTARGILIEPASNTSALLSAALVLARTPQGGAGLQGTITVDEAEFQKNIDIGTVIRAVIDYLLKSRQRETISALPPIDLDVSISAARNMLVATNLVGAELAGSLHLIGTAKDPILKGRIESLSGWFLVKDRRFDITSGGILFNPGSLEPTLDILGETTINTVSGESALVLVEISGPLSQARVQLSSDRGLSQREILTLLSSAGTIRDQVLVGASQRELQSQDTISNDEDFVQSIQKIIRGLTRIDSVSLEPTYRVESGTIEPTLIATKRLTDRFELRGESSLGAVSDQRLLGIYRLSPSLHLASSIQSVSTERNVLLGVDLVYAAFGRQRPFVTIDLSGNDKISKEKLLRALRLSTLSRIPLSEIEKIRAAIVTHYHNEGFFGAEAEVLCLQGSDFCRQLSIRVEELAPVLVDSYVLEGDTEHAAFVEQDLAGFKVGKRATMAHLEKYRGALLRHLRSEGYIAARVNAEYRAPLLKDSSALSAVAVFTVNAGKPVSFVFTGNSIFRAEDFLKTIDLFKRKQPFGANTINILTENIERLYREAGYLYASINFEKDDVSDPQRIRYLISILEDAKVEVDQVRLTGLDSAAEQRLRERLFAQSASRYHALIYPPAAIEEELELNTETIREALIEDGYPQARADHVIISKEGEPNASKVAIEYRISLGSPVRFKGISIQGLPLEVPAPEPIEGALSVPNVNRFSQNLYSLLREQGFHRAEISTILDEHETLEVRVAAGQRTIIDEILVQGNVATSDKVIRRSMPVTAGEAWNDAQLSEGKRKLLKLGLFSRVELEPRDGQIDSEHESLVIKVTERPLRTFEIGGGLNSEYGMHLFGEYVDRSLFSDGKNLSTRIDGYYDPVKQEVSQGIAGIQFSNPYLFGSEYALTEDLRYQKLDVSTQEFNLDRYSLASYVSRTWHERFSLSIGHTILRDNLTDVAPGAILSDLDEGLVTSSFLSGVASWDQRNDSINPTSGYLLSTDWMLASESLLSDANFISLGGRASWTTPTPFWEQPFSVALSARGAGTWTYAGTSDVPITQRFYLGGRTSVRGFRENSLGPRGSEGAVIGGDMLLAGSFELRYGIAEHLSVHSFFDIGNVFLQHRSMPLTELRESAGVGIRYLSPLGPLGFDIGAPLDKKSGEPSVLVHFSIGSNF